MQIVMTLSLVGLKLCLQRHISTTWRVPLRSAYVSDLVIVGPCSHQNKKTWIPVQHARKKLQAMECDLCDSWEHFTCVWEHDWVDQE